MNKEELDKHRRILIELNKELKQENKQLKEENYKLQKCLNEEELDVQDQNRELGLRIDKAIDKLYLWGETLNPTFQKEMLEILGGKDESN